MEIVEHLAHDLGITARQALGGAGLLLEFAQRRMSREEFVQLADTVPVISDLIGKAPRVDAKPSRPLLATFSRWFGGLGGLAGLTAGFEKLGCEKAMIPKFVSSLTEYFRERGGEEVETVLRDALR